MDHDSLARTTTPSRLRGVRRALLLLVIALAVPALFIAGVVAVGDLSSHGDEFDGLGAMVALMVAVPTFVVAAGCALSLVLMSIRPAVEPVVTLLLGGVLTLVSAAGVFGVGVAWSSPVLVLAAAMAATAAPDAWRGPTAPEPTAGQYRPQSPAG